MKKAFILASFIVTLAASAGVFAQFPQMERSRQRLEAMRRADEANEHDKRLENEAALPVPKPAVMNVDVQIVLSKGEFKTFAEAKAAEAKKIVDGEPLWLYIKFKSKLGDYVLTTRHPDDRERLRYTLFAEVAPRGDITALNQYTILFAKEDLPLPEVKINLAPGMFGRNKSIPVFLMTSGAAKTGVWNNEFRLTNNVAMPRLLTDNLSSVPVTLDFVGGTAKYKKMDSEYDSIVLRGSTDLTKLPAAGTFYNENLQLALSTQLAAADIKPTAVYFSGDDWQEFASFGLGLKKTKRIFATFKYRRGEDCFYGVAEIVQNYDFMLAKFAAPEIKLQKDLTAACTEVAN